MPASIQSSPLATAPASVIRFARRIRSPNKTAAPASDLSYSFFFLPMVLRRSSRRGLLFHRAMNWATVAAWPALPPSERPAHRSSLKRCSASLGRFPVGLPSMTFRHGASPTTGLILFRSPLRKSKCSSAGSAISSTNCFPRPFELTIRRLP